MADDRSLVTELATGLGMLGYPGPTMALRARPAEFADLPSDVWGRLVQLRSARRFDADFVAGFTNGRTFLEARDGLRGRKPALVEWRAGRLLGVTGVGGGEPVPADLRVDHVYLVSCRYLQPLVASVPPAHLFTDLLAQRGRRGQADWYGEVAPTEYQALYSAARAWLGPAGAALPPLVAQLQPADRAVLKTALAGRWPPALRAAARAWCVAVAHASANRWARRLAAGGAAEELLLRLLRIGSAPSYVLATRDDRSMRLRLATPWDWRQRFALRRLSVFPRAGSQPRVGWQALVVERQGGEAVTVSGQVEVRWTRGRFSGPPVARVLLDTSPAQVPGYFGLIPA